MRSTDISTSFVNIPADYKQDLIARGYREPGVQIVKNSDTLCVSLHSKDFYDIPPTYGEAIVATLNEFDALCLLAQLGSTGALRNLLEAEYKICDE